MTTKAEQVLRSFLPPSLKGPGWDIRLAVIGKSEQANWDYAQFADLQLFDDTATGKYLDRRAAKYGIERADALGLEDETFRQLLAAVTSSQLTPESFMSILEIYYGLESTHANVVSDAQTFVISDGDTLGLLFDKKIAVSIVFHNADFHDPSVATAIEVVGVLNKAFNQQGLPGFAMTYTDPETNGVKVVVYTKTAGIGGSIGITDGLAFFLPTSATLYNQSRAAYIKQSQKDVVKVVLPATSSVVTRGPGLAPYILLNNPMVIDTATTTDGQTTTTITTPGTSSWTASSAGVADVVCIGAGGCGGVDGPVSTGGTAPGGGGGGGAWATGRINVKAGDVFPTVVGAGGYLDGSTSTNGGSTYFGPYKQYVTANGGYGGYNYLWPRPGVGGDAASCSGSIVFSGGSGTDAYTFGVHAGGGGGSTGGKYCAGRASGSYLGGEAVTGGYSGGDGAIVGNAPPVSGHGGGGGGTKDVVLPGGFSYTFNPASGADGYMSIVFTPVFEMTVTTPYDYPHNLLEGAQVLVDGLSYAENSGGSGRLNGLFVVDTVTDQYTVILTPSEPRLAGVAAATVVTTGATMQAVDAATHAQPNAIIYDPSSGLTITETAAQIANMPLSIVGLWINDANTQLTVQTASGHGLQVSDSAAINTTYVCDGIPGVLSATLVVNTIISPVEVLFDLTPGAMPPPLYVPTVTTSTFTTNGIHTVTLPVGGVTDLSVQLWGGGGGGGGGKQSVPSLYGGGGGAGAFAYKSGLSYSSANVIVTVGAGGAGGNAWSGNGVGQDGASTTFSGDPLNPSDVARASGGRGATSVPNSGATPGVGGLAGSCIGDVVYSGGSGSVADGLGYGGGGGGSAGPGGDGNNGRTPGAGGNGAVPVTSGGPGGDGGDGVSVTGHSPSIGPGGGGGGGAGSTGVTQYLRIGGNGKDGQAIISYSQDVLAEVYFNTIGSTLQPTDLSNISSTVIQAGHAVSLLDVTDATQFPNESGYIVIGFGYGYETKPIAYYGLASATQLRIDPAFKFLNDIPVGASVNLLNSRTSAEPTDTVTAGGFYLCNPSIGRETAIRDIGNMAAAGISVESRVKYPGDWGLANAGSPTFGATRLSDIVSCFAGDDVDVEIEEARNEE